MYDQNFENVKEYWNILSKEAPFNTKDHWVDDKGIPLEENLFKEIGEYVLKYKPLNTSRCSILDVGCGTGRVLKNIEFLSPEDLTFGIDFSSEQISAAKKMNINSRLFVGDIFQFIEENPNYSKEGFDMIYLHGVTQYFTNDEYFNNFLIATHKLLRKNGTLIIMDTPIDWYTEYMKSKPRCTLTFLFKEKIKSIIPTKLLDKIRVILKKKSISETVGNIEIKAPSFRGYWVNPETIQKFAESKFTNYEMNYQTFEHKPRIYKRFRPNFILEGKK